MFIFKYIGLLMFVSLLYLSCSKEEGCIDPNASNYEYEAKKGDGNCLYDMGFWMNGIDHLPAYIYIDGEFRDSLMCGWIQGEPKCGVDTFVYTNIGYIRCTANIPLKPGNHEVKVVGRDGTIWESTIKLPENCVNVLIQNPE